MTQEFSQATAAGSQGMGRRKLLKALSAAGSGLFIAATLPDTWVEPVISVGYLPAHAQTSQFTISNLSRELTNPGTPELCQNGPNDGNLYRIAFEYLNPAGAVKSGIIINHAYAFANGLSGAFEVIAGPTNISGDGFEGTISYTVCSAFGDPLNDSVTTTVSVRDENGQSSNQISQVASRPAGVLQAGSKMSPFEKFP